MLMYSATFYEEEEEEDKEKKELTEEEKRAQEEKEKKQEKALMTGTLIFSVVIAVAVFMMLPYFLSNLFRNLTDSRWVLSLVESAVRVIIFLGYLFPGVTDEGYPADLHVSRGGAQVHQLH